MDVIGYVVVQEGEDLKNGIVDFKKELKHDLIYPDKNLILNDAVGKTIPSINFYIYKIKFVELEEIIIAINCSVYDNSWSKFTIEVLDTYQY